MLEKYGLFLQKETTSSAGLEPSSVAVGIFHALCCDVRSYKQERWSIEKFYNIFIKNGTSEGFSPELVEIAELLYKKGDLEQIVSAHDKGLARVREEVESLYETDDKTGLPIIDLNEALERSQFLQRLLQPMPLS
jgi:hypothetical protein